MSDYLTDKEVADYIAHQELQYVPSPEMYPGLRAAREVAEMRMLVRGLAHAQWEGEGGHHEEAACPDCGGSPYGDPAEGHTDRCDLAPLLRMVGVSTDPKDRDA